MKDVDIALGENLAANLRLEAAAMEVARPIMERLEAEVFAGFKMLEITSAESRTLRMALGSSWHFNTDPKKASHQFMGVPVAIKNRAEGRMTEKEEQAFEQGRRAANVNLLKHLLREVGKDDPLAAASRWAVERAEIILKLREICGEHGDNDWPDDLHIADILDKHLLRHLNE